MPSRQEIISFLFNITEGWWMKNERDRIHIRRDFIGRRDGSRDNHCIASPRLLKKKYFQNSASHQQNHITMGSLFEQPRNAGTLCKASLELLQSFVTNKI
jgi:hypothetical protein